MPRRKTTYCNNVVDAKITHKLLYTAQKSKEKTWALLTFNVLGPPQQCVSKERIVMKYVTKILVSPIFICSCPMHVALSL